MTLQRKQLELVVEDLKVCYRDTLALDIPTLRLTAGILGLIGHNGSGKSTLLKTLLKVLTPTTGTAAVLDLTPSGSVAIPTSELFFSTESGSVFADISIHSYLQMWSRIRFHHSRYETLEGFKYFERLGIARLLKKRGRELSKGQRRRVHIAAGLIYRPRVFTLDEPFDGLDLEQASVLTDILKEESAHMSIIVSSHRIDVIERLADTILVLRRGEAFTAGSVEVVCKALAGDFIESLSLTDAVNYHLLQAAQSLE